MSNMKSIAFSFLFFSFLLTIGPPLPKAMYEFSMLEMHGNTYVIGGFDKNWAVQSSIYQLSCSSGLCSWTTLNQQLNLARRFTVAIAVQDNFCT